MLHKNQQSNSKQLTIVIKVGTSSICNEVTHFPLLSNLSAIVETVLGLRSLGHRVVLVTSAAVGTGLRRLNMPEKPSSLAARQVRRIQETIHHNPICLGCGRCRSRTTHGVI